jgi:hypothetical protein
MARQRNVGKRASRIGLENLGESFHLLRQASIDELKTTRRAWAGVDRRSLKYLLGKLLWTPSSNSLAPNRLRSVRNFRSNNSITIFEKAVSLATGHARLVSACSTRRNRSMAYRRNGPTTAPKWALLFLSHSATGNSFLHRSVSGPKGPGTV